MEFTFRLFFSQTLSTCAMGMATNEPSDSSYSYAVTVEHRSHKVRNCPMTVLEGPARLYSNNKMNS